MTRNHQRLSLFSISQYTEGFEEGEGKGCEAIEEISEIPIERENYIEMFSKIPLFFLLTLLYSTIKFWILSKIWENLQSKQILSNFMITGKFFFGCTVWKKITISSKLLILEVIFSVLNHVQIDRKIELKILISSKSNN